MSHLAAPDRGLLYLVKRRQAEVENLVDSSQDGFEDR